MSLHVRHAYGGWPDHAIDNFPAGLLEMHFFLFFAATAFAMLVAIPLWIVCVCIRSLRLTFHEHLLQVGTFIGTSALYVAVITYFPGMWLTWFLD
jgi:hypothetical protein